MILIFSLEYKTENESATVLSVHHKELSRLISFNSSMICMKSPDK